MKKRLGFVSNSSSSSFCIYGALVYFDEVKSKLTEEGIKKLKEFWKTKTEEGRLSESTEPPEQKGLIYGVDKYELCDALWIPHTTCSEEGYYAIGYSPSSIEDNETGAQFRERVSEEIKKYFNITEFGWHEGEYYC